MRTIILGLAIALFFFASILTVPAFAEGGCNINPSCECGICAKTGCNCAETPCCSACKC